MLRTECILNLRLEFWPDICLIPQSIPISHNPCGRWDKYRRAPWPMMRRRKTGKMRKKRKKHVEPGQSAAQWGPECSISRKLEDTGEDDAQRGASFCTVLFHSTLFFACSHICCLVVCVFVCVCVFFTTPLVSKVHIFMYKFNSFICKKKEVIYI